MKELDKYIRKNNLDLTISMISSHELGTYGSHTRIVCLKTGDVFLDIKCSSIPTDETILQWIKPIIRQRKLNQLFNNKI